MFALYTSFILRTYKTILVWTRDYINNVEYLGLDT